ncbi:MAG: AmmeMemoRadiSam system protein B [Planctomycetota bacterium]|jgi:AmmeMemoRadiSam system protein B/AmmeMemoRadiSam system protein A
MDTNFRMRIVLELLIVGAIIFLGIPAFLFWKVQVPKHSSATEEAASSQAEAAGKRPESVLRSALAGRWYYADADKLSKQIEGFLQKADVKPKRNVIALILPHAGYQYSGQTAAFGLKTIDKKYKRIVVIGPSHRAPMENMLSVPRVTHYETPLGRVSLDVEFITELLKFPLFQNLPYAHQYEHSVQIELPLLQHCQGVPQTRYSAFGGPQRDFEFVPIVAGRCSLPTIRKAAAILAGLIDKETLVVASSDFVHYGRNYSYVPFTENIPEQIKNLDMGAYEHIAKLDAGGFLDYRRRTGATICGSVPVAILLSMFDKETKAELVEYATSGELTGDYSNSVSYLSVVFTGAWQNPPPVQPRKNRTELTQRDKEQLLTLARKSIMYALEERQLPEAADLGVTISPVMKAPRAAFVTLKKNGGLRGCIGDIFPQRPLYKSVIINAINAALNDRRFVPVTKDECGILTVEISALTPPEPVASYDRIRIGTDGVVLRKDGRSAVFLPQVAPEQGWDLNQTLTRLSQKAGLPPDAWKEGASFLVFQAEVFGEEK